MKWRFLSSNWCCYFVAGIGFLTVALHLVSFTLLEVHRYHAAEVPEPRDYTACTFETCFEFSSACHQRLSVGLSAPMQKPRLVKPVEPDPQMLELQEALQGSIFEDDPQQACVRVPNFSTLCPDNRCSPSPLHLSYLVHLLPQYREGRNHMIFHLGDGDSMPFDTEGAMLARSSFRFSKFRPGFDIAIPLLPRPHSIVPRSLTPRPLAERSIDVAYVDTLDESTLHRAQLAFLHAPPSRVVWLGCALLPSQLDYSAELPDAPDATLRDVCTRDGLNLTAQRAEEADLEDAKFGVVVRGAGRQSRGCLSPAFVALLMPRVSEQFD